MIDSIGIGQSYLVKYLATNSYVPFITVFLKKFLGKREINTFFEYDSEDEEEDYRLDLFSPRDYELDDSYDGDADVDADLEDLAEDLPEDDFLSR